MRDVRLCTLQWAVGALCAATGALIYVAPHHFGAPAYTWLQPGLRWWGALFLIGGVALLGTVALTRRRTLAVAAHVLSGLALLGMAISLIQAGAWISGVNYLAVAVGLVAGLALPNRAGPADAGRDALAAVVGLGSAATGLLILLAPGQFSAPGYDSVRAILWAFGLVFLATGTALLIVQHPRVLQPARVAACLLGGLTLLTFLALVALPSRVWAGGAYFGIFGAFLMVLPWLAPRLQRVDPVSLRTRLVFVLTTATAVPLIVTIALVSNQQEQITASQTQALQQTLARVLAQDVADFVQLHRAAVAGVATQPDLLVLPREEQRRQLVALRRAYPAVTLFALYDREGRGLARSDAQPPSILTGMADFEAFRVANRPGTHVLPNRQTGQPVIGLMEPVRGGDGAFAGLVLGSLEPSPIARLVGESAMAAGAAISIVDEQGRLIVESGPAPRPPLTDLSTEPPIALLLARPDTAGSLRFGLGADERLAGYAPVAGSDWGIVISQPVGAALASVQAGRELAFALLMAVVVGAAIAGVVVAGWVGRPLATLVRAVDQFAAGNAGAPLPRTQLTEVRRLAQGFGALRDRLVARTAEREQAEERLRFLADASRHLASSLDFTETLASVARQVVPVLGDYAIVDLLDEHGQTQRVATAASDPRRELLVRQLLQFPADSNATGVHSIGRVLRTGQADLLPVITDRDIDDIAAAPEHRALLRALRPTSHVIVPLTARGRTIGALTFALASPGRQYSPTDLALAEELARRAALAIDHATLYREAQVAVRAREEFLSIASHELRTPLTTVKGYAQYLQRRAQRIDASDGHSVEEIGAVTHLADQLLGQVGRLEALVDDLLDVSRMQLGRLDLRPEPVDLTELAREVLARFEQAPERTDQHRLALVAPAPVLGHWDANRLDQVLTNLVSNALKYSPDGGEVCLTVRGLAEMAELTVGDDGIGITAADQARLFQPFARGESARQRFAGTGLGLFIAAQIVERHGGTLTVDSTPDAGSLFTVRLPYDGGPPAAPRPAHQDQPA
ncbi:MAG: GAF domain-containing protein [Chloroflexi bacterium]|nr:GAF domain-containing protein [Chloroflexota bacterium]